jgi:amidase
MPAIRRTVRSIAQYSAVGIIAAAVFGVAIAVKAEAPNKREFSIVDKTVAELQDAMAAGRITSKSLTAKYLARIKAIDKAGPRINAIIEVNPEALAIADALDKERKLKGPRGPLHGIPVLLKDNIGTADRMQTTAGSLALVGAKAPRDSFVAARLREAGAVILGKTNLSEWANLRSTRSTSGWSARGGLTRNPYALDRNTSGSSSGSGAAVAAGLAALAVGSETDGSIVSPSSINGIVGIKPTLGLVSRAGVIPIAHSQDTTGPMALTVADAAALLTAMAGTDPRDQATADASAKAIDYTKVLDQNALKGARLGVVRSSFGGRNDQASAEIEKALAVLKAQGAILIDIPELPDAGKIGEPELEVLLYEFKTDLNAYLAEYAQGAPVKTMADVIAFNEKNKAKEMPFFEQELLIRAEAKGGLDSKEYLDALATSRGTARAGIDKVMSDNKLDALVAPTGSPAWLTDFINGDAEGDSFSTPAAVAGYPHITVPAGFVHGLPCGISFVGIAWSEPRLIALAYAFEQATHHRRPPNFPKTVNRGDKN